MSTRNTLNIPNIGPNESNTKSNSNSSKLKVLVVVDVQNCFIAGGSYGGHEKNSIDGDKLANSISQIIEISELIDSNDSIIFTRDYHPINHLSIGNGKKVAINYGATHPTHCLNTNSNVCPRNINLGLTENEIKKIRSRSYISIGDYLKKIDSIEFKNNNRSRKNLLKIIFKIIPKEFYKQQIIGTNLNWLYSITSYAPIISELINKNNPIGIEPKKYKSQDPQFSNITIPEPYKVNGKKFIQLVKGQLCGYESYSAFNYHLKLEKSKNKTTSGPVKYTSKYITPIYEAEKDKNLKNLSTGLFEYILTNEKKKHIEITVCGLVGEICIINTIIEGLIMWNLLYQESFTEKSVIFNYSLSGTLFTGLGLFGFDKTVEQNDFFNKMRDYLDKSVNDKYKTYIRFNVSDDNKLIGRFYYSSKMKKFIAKKIANNVNGIKRINNNNNINNNNINNFKKSLISRLLQR